MSLDHYVPEPRKLLSLWRGEILAPAYRSHTVRAVVDLVAERHGVKPAEILGRSRQRRIVHARQEAMYICRSIRREDGTPRYGYPEIGRRLGGRDHCTVWHGVRNHAARHGLGLPDDA